MSGATLVFHGELQDFLPGVRDSGRVDYALQRRASVKDVVEAVGPPHTEVGDLSINGSRSDFERILRPGDVVQVHPHNPPVDPTSATLLQPEPLDELRFIVDVNVGKLARMLRMLGFDAAYDWRWTDGHIAAVTGREGRVVLSKDRGLLKRKEIVWGRLVRAEQPGDQIREVLRFFGIDAPKAPFSRCLRCNVLLEQVDKREILHRLEPKTKKHFQRFHICPDCGRIYWQGSHHESMRSWLDSLADRELS